jgi:hypothetical protein
MRVHVCTYFSLFIPCFIIVIHAAYMVRFVLELYRSISRFVLNFTANDVNFNASLIQNIFLAGAITSRVDIKRCAVLQELLWTQ